MYAMTFAFTRSYSLSFCFPSSGPHLSDPILTQTVISLFFFLGSLPFFYMRLYIRIASLLNAQDEGRNQQKITLVFSLSGLRPNTKEGIKREGHQVNHLFAPPLYHKRRNIYIFFSVGDSVLCASIDLKK